MTPDILVRSMTPDVFERLRTSVETGKWLNGEPLTQEQKETSIRAIMLYQSKVLGSEEHMTVNGEGELVHKSRQQLKQELNSQSEIARFKQDDF